MTTTKVTTPKSAAISGSLVGLTLFALGLPLLDWWLSHVQMALGAIIFVGIVGAVYGGGLSWAVGCSLVKGDAKPTIPQLLVAQVAGLTLAWAVLWLPVSSWLTTGTGDPALVIVIAGGFGLWVGRYTIFPLYQSWRQKHPAKVASYGPPSWHPEQLG